MTGPSHTAVAHNDLNLASDLINCLVWQAGSEVPQLQFKLLDGGQKEVPVEQLLEKFKIKVKVDWQKKDISDEDVLQNLLPATDAAPKKAPLRVGRNVNVDLIERGDEGKKKTIVCNFKLDIKPTAPKRFDARFPTNDDGATAIANREPVTEAQGWVFQARLHMPCGGGEGGRDGGGVGEMGCLAPRTQTGKNDALTAFARTAAKGYAGPAVLLMQPPPVCGQVFASNGQTNTKTQCAQTWTPASPS